MKQLGIKRKVSAGCIILGMILFFSSMMSVYEFSNMNSYVSRVLSENIENINSSRDFLETAEIYNLKLMHVLEDGDREFNDIDRRDLANNFSKIKGNYNTAKEKNAADSVIFAYSAYMQAVREGYTKWDMEPIARKEWFFEHLQPIYLKLRHYVQALTFVSQDELIKNSNSLKDNFYRSMVPSMVSLILSLLLVLLFNYYLNFYLINPFLKVTKGIMNYRKFNKPYNVSLDSDDEISELNSAVSDLIDLNSSYKNQLKK